MKKLALTLVATLATGTAVAAQTPEELLIEWGYMSKPVVQTPIVEFAPIQPQDGAEAYLLAHGFPVVRKAGEQELLGTYAIEPAKVVKGDAVHELLVEWNHIKRPTSFSAIYVPNDQNS
jgi:hypothetical protein